jgi:serine protease Do
MKAIREIIGLLTYAMLCASIVGCEGQVNQVPKQKEDSTAVVSLETKQKKGRSKIDTTQFSITSKLPATDFRYAASKVTPAVVHVNSSWKISDNQGELRPYDPLKDFFGDDWFKFFGPFRQRGPVQGSASGVIVTPDGYIITNNHVVQDADDVEVVLHDQRSYKAKIIGSDPKTDLSLLKIEEDNLSFIEFGNSDDVEVGEWVLAVGKPIQSCIDCNSRNHKCEGKEHRNS